MSSRRTHFSANPLFVKKKTVLQTPTVGGDVSAFLRNSPEAKQKEGNKFVSKEVRFVSVLK